MSKLMRKIVYYENILEFKENTDEELSLHEINNWQLCRTCLADTNEDDVNMEKMSVIDAMQGIFLSIKEMLLTTTNVNITSSAILPLRVCRECFSKITALYYFSLQVRKADKVLNRLASKLKHYQVVHDSFTLENNVTECEMTDDNVIVELEEVSGQPHVAEIASDDSINSENENKELGFELEKCADIKETSDLFEEISDADAALLKDAECRSEIKHGCIDEENFLEKDLFEWSEGSDVDNQETFTDNSTVTITTETLRSQTKRRTKGVNKNAPSSGYRHKQPRVSSPLLTDFTCGICQYNFGRQHDLVQHVRELHPNSKAYTCRVCGNLFSHIQSLSRHMNIHKEAVVLNECKFCPKTFVRVDDLKRHLRVHTGERPYVCSICEKTFQQQHALKNHEEKHQYEGKNLQPPKFECTQCSQTYISRNGLYLHRRKHHSQDSEGDVLSHDCSLCEKSFHLQSELKRHVKKHILPKSIKRNTCDKSSKSQYNRLKHIKRLHDSHCQSEKESKKENEHEEHFAMIENIEELNENNL